MANPNPNQNNSDQQQILQRAFDDVTERLRVEVDAATTVTIDNASITVDIDSTTDSIQIKDAAGDALAIGADGSISVNVPNGIEVKNSSTGAQVLSSAPVGDTGERALAVRVISQLGVSETADGAIQDGANPALKATVTATNALKVDGSAVTQPVSGTVTVSNLPATQAISATALPLPTGAATEVTLIEVRDRLSNIEGYVDQLEIYTDTLEALNTATYGAVDGLEALATSSNTILTDIEAALDGVEGLLTTTNSSLTTIQDTMAAVAGYVDTLETQIAALDLTVSDGSQVTQIVDSTTGAQVLATAPVSDVGQRAIAVRVVSQLGVSETADGAIQDGSNPAIKATVTGANALKVDGSAVTQPVSIASMPATPVTDNGGSLTVDGSVSVSNFPATQPVSGPLTDVQLRASAVPVAMSSVPLAAGAATEATLASVNTNLTGGTTGALSNVAASISSQTLRAANSSRKRLMLFNDSTQSCFVAFAATASSTSFTLRMAPYSLYIMEAPPYTGIVTGIWSAADASGAMRVTEIT